MEFDVVVFSRRTHESFNFNVALHEEDGLMHLVGPAGPDYGTYNV